MISWHRFYDPATGRYISADPIGLEGGINLYAYVGGNPVNAVDPWGLVDWNGSMIQMSVSSFVGATGARFKLESECVNNKKARVTVWAAGPTLALGAKFGVTASSVTFHDYNSEVDPHVFDGRYAILQAGATLGTGLPVKPVQHSIPPRLGQPGFGVGAAIITLGSAYSDPKILVGGTIGIDRAVSFSLGSSTVTDSKVSECCDNE